MEEQDQKKIEDVLMEVTPVSKYENIKEWYEDFKKTMRREMKK